MHFNTPSIRRVVEFCISCFDWTTKLGVVLYCAMPRLKVLSKQVGVLRPVNRYGYIRAIKGPETYVYCRAETKDALYNNEGCK